MLAGMKELGLLPARQLRTRWVVDCRCVGAGLPALKYLSRYLYRGVIGERQLISDDGESVTFSYTDGKSGKTLTRTVSGAHFVWLLIQHVLPSGFRRVRDYGFLHGNARPRLLRVQWLLRIMIPIAPAQSTRSALTCRRCGEAMTMYLIAPPCRQSG